jgi:hypothetical protein
MRSNSSISSTPTPISTYTPSPMPFSSSSSRSSLLYIPSLSFFFSSTPRDLPLFFSRLAHARPHTRKLSFFPFCLCDPPRPTIFQKKKKKSERALVCFGRRNFFFRLAIIVQRKFDVDTSHTSSTACVSFCLHATKRPCSYRDCRHHDCYRHRHRQISRIVCRAIASW